jgi:hypothetical protein
MGVLDVEEVRILRAIVLQETMLVVKPLNHLTLSLSKKLVATVVDVTVTLPEIVTQEQTSMVFVCN